MCSSEFGKLGFFHAMMSVDDFTPIAEAREQGAESADLRSRMMEKTRRKILAWVSFAYRVAKGDLNPDDAFCSAVSKDPELADAFSDGDGCRTADAKWTIRKVFTFVCPNPKLDRECKSTTDTSDAKVRLAALGALLHVIQDSYTQTHVRRLVEPVRDSSGKLAAVIVCAAPKQYYFFDPKNPNDGHNNADAAPSIRLCGQSDVDDPVSAGATVLWLLRVGRPAGDLATYLSQRVFPIDKD
jgi:hypothetical protein